jgi:hypothetical protein
MACWNFSHWAKEILFSFGSSERNIIWHLHLLDNFYLYQALVAGQTQP